MTPRSTELYFRKMLPLGLIFAAIVLILGWVNKEVQMRKGAAEFDAKQQAQQEAQARIQKLQSLPKPMIPTPADLGPHQTFEALMAKLGDPVSVETQAGKPTFFWHKAQFEVQLDSQRRIVSISTPAYDAAPAAAVELSEITGLKIRQWQDENKDLWITLE